MCAYEHNRRSIFEGQKLFSDSAELCCVKAKTGYNLSMDIPKTIVTELTKTKVSLRQISIDIGLNVSIVCRARQGRMIEADTASKLLTYFGYTLCKSGGKPKPLKEPTPC